MVKININQYPLIIQLVLELLPLWGKGGLKSKTMKSKIILSALILSVSFAAKAQVAIGKTPVPPATTVEITNSSVLLEFGTEAKGIIVPQVASAPSAAGGTFIFNSSAGVLAMQVYEGRNDSGNGGWTNLTGNSIPGAAHTFVNSGTDKIPATGAGAIIGADNTSKRGALVLESTTKALVLPKVANPHLNIKSPVAGTMVYDITADMLAVYDGANWSFWK